MALDAMIFDLDGTLVDTNALHIEAWRRAFEARGYKIAPDRIFVEVGKGGDKLVPAILGKQADEKDGEALRKAHPKEFAKLAREQTIRVFPQATELLRELHRRGLKLVLATSSAKEHIDAIEKSAGIDLSELFDDIAMGDDADQSKPAPDIVTAAVKKLGMSPAQCAMVGDTPYDAIAARDAGVIGLGVICGGHDEETLFRHGARAVWRDPAHLLDDLDRALKLASPGAAHLTQKAMEKLMELALQAASDGMNRGEAPIGCILALGNGTLVASGYNELNHTHNKTAHAEMVTFAKAAGKCDPDCRDLILVSTLEPCVMCTGAAMEAAVDTILFALRAPADSGTGRVRPPQSPECQMPRIVGNILADRSRKLFEEFLKKNPPEKQARYVKQLLELNEK